jgi:hypothetical protein
MVADFRNAAIEPNILVDNAVPLPSRAQRSPRLYILSCYHLKDRRLSAVDVARPNVFGNPR